MNRWILTTALALALAAGTAAAEAKNTLRWSSQGDALTADPHAQNEGPTNAASLNIYDPLIRRNAKSQLESSLALSWKSINPTTWEFKLRQNVKFHDGTPFTADDVVFSIGRAKSPTSDFKSYFDSVTEVKKIDAYTVHFITKGPNPILPNQVTQISIMSKAWAEKHKVERPQDFKNKEETYAIRNAMGTGPYMLKKRDPGIETVLERNPNWWGWKTPQGGGNVDEIIYKPIKNAATRVAALLSGEIDFVLDPPVQDVEKIRREAKLKISTTPQIRTIFFGLDVGRKELRSSDVKGKNPFADKRVRQAIQLAIDVQAIKRVTMRGMSQPAGIVTSPGVDGYSPAIDKPVAANVDQAKTLLKQAGYPNGFSVKLDCPNDRYTNDEQICQAAVGMLGKIGIKVQLDSQSKTLHFPKIQKYESDFYLLGWGVPTQDSHYVFNYLYATRSGGKGGWNGTGYSSPKMDDLIAKMEVETDVKKRNAFIAEAWALAKADLIYIPIHHQVINWGMVKTLDLPIVVDDAPHFRWAKMGPAAKAAPGKKTN
ncbi:MAG TPA: ABC transporter substrate-binding protein [Alphaproteobacteria bacterium]|jgi:peptide/nickel transport system substrate-binding protein